MARRKRLTPAEPLQAGQIAVSGSLPGPLSGTVRAPIAQVAGDAAAAAAFHDLAGEVTRARVEGRMVLSLALDAVRDGHLMRDRMRTDPEEMATLMDSLRARGQQTPIEVVALPDGQYGLVSGWRRLAALRALWSETGEARFGQVQALLRRPANPAEAYVAMVEENEIRADLSFYERARIVRLAVEAGVFAEDQAAINTLFAAATHTRRSKVKSFLRIVDVLEEVLRHPARLSEHLGLKLSRALAQDPRLAGRIAAALEEIDPQDEAAEIATIKRVLMPEKRTGRALEIPDQTDSVSRISESESDPKPEVKPEFQPVISGLSLRREGNSLTLLGPRITRNFVKGLERYLKSLE